MLDSASLSLPDFEPGHVWLVGAGPGDPGLLSVLALHALAHADVVVYDALVDPDLAIAFMAQIAPDEHVERVRSLNVEMSKISIATP